jgi:ubiquinone/menaquinone biosynthesis C-methylase UbiE
LAAGGVRSSLESDTRTSSQEGNTIAMPHNHTSRTEHDYLPAMGRDWLLPLYDSFTWLVGVPRLHRRLAAEAGIEPGHRVLEVGTGTGNLALRARRMQPAAEVIGLDPDPRALARARRKSERRGLPVQWVQGTAGQLPYPDASIDRVLSSLMFHHLDNTERHRMLTEVHRVLRPGGRLHLVDFAGHHKGRAARRLHKHPQLLELAGDAIPDAMREAGLTDVRATGTGHMGTTFYRATR